jgi:hypothetical protein
MERVSGETVEDVVDVTAAPLPDCADEEITVALAGVTLVTTTLPSVIW